MARCHDAFRRRRAGTLFDYRTKGKKIKKEREGIKPSLFEKETRNKIIRDEDQKDQAKDERGLVRTSKAIIT